MLDGGRHRPSSIAGFGHDVDAGETVVSGALFPLLALGTLGFELWLGALAIHWLREHSSK